ncbi:hypothetical protein SCHIN_v1c07740 [Spiroplasma chinense]|uniref:Uncharacterized protein n=1 Tax=Spiroplasma chinense TaxID=216932 RepID=A0A5B9Y5J3_9MOLU|nr:hypothetical protein [Spiroplasma chinense]QEH61969.1 hypothetical protein SCHIN_v1c07740 [Spiroplasma chinense]
MNIKMEDFENKTNNYERICLSGNYGAGKTYLKDEFFKKNKDFLKVELNAVNDKDSIIETILVNLKRNKWLSWRCVIATYGGGPFLIKLRAFLNTFLSILAPVLFSVALGILVSKNNYVGFKLNFTLGFAISFLIIFFIIFYILVFSLWNLKPITNYSLEKIKLKKAFSKSDLYFVIEDLNRIKTEEQYKFLTDFILYFDKLKLISNKKSITLMDIEQFDRRDKNEIEFGKYFDCFYYLKYNKKEKNEILRKIINDSKYNNNQKKLWEILHCERTLNWNVTISNFNLLINYFANFRDIILILEKLNSFFDEYDGKFEFVSNDLFDINFLQVYDNELYFLILNHPSLLSINWLYMDGKENVPMDENAKKFKSKISEKKDNNFYQIIDKFVIFSDTLLYKQSFYSNFKDEPLRNSITKLQNFEFYINPSWHKDLKNVYLKLDKIEDFANDYKVLFEVLKENQEYIESSLNCNEVLKVSDDIAILLNKYSDKLYFGSEKKFMTYVEIQIKVHHLEKITFNITKFIFSLNKEYVISILNRVIENEGPSNLQELWIMNYIYSRFRDIAYSSSDEGKLQSLLKTFNFNLAFDEIVLLNKKDSLIKIINKIYKFDNDSFNFLINLCIIDNQNFRVLFACYSMENYKKVIDSALERSYNDQNYEKREKLTQFLVSKLRNDIINFEQEKNRIYKEKREFLDKILEYYEEKDFK